MRPCPTPVMAPARRALRMAAGRLLGASPTSRGSSPSGRPGHSWPPQPPGSRPECWAGWGRRSCGALTTPSQTAAARQSAGSRPRRRLAGAGARGGVGSLRCGSTRASACLPAPERIKEFRYLPRVQKAAALFTRSGSAAYISMVATWPHEQRMGFCRLLVAELQAHIGGDSTAVLHVESTTGMEPLWRGKFGFSEMRGSAAETPMFSGSFWMTKQDQSTKAGRNSAWRKVWQKEKQPRQSRRDSAVKSSGLEAALKTGPKDNKRKHGTAPTASKRKEIKKGGAANKQEAAAEAAANAANEKAAVAAASSSDYDDAPSTETAGLSGLLSLSREELLKALATPREWARH
eukprot:SAG22_NODE_517_length_9528_cov_3.821508_4_plen_348_part_00